MSPLLSGAGSAEVPHLSARTVSVKSVNNIYIGRNEKEWLISYGALCLGLPVIGISGYAINEPHDSKTRHLLLLFGAALGGVAVGRGFFGLMKDANRSSDIINKKNRSDSAGESKNRPAVPGSSATVSQHSV